MGKTTRPLSTGMEQRSQDQAVKGQSVRPGATSQPNLAEIAKSLGKGKEVKNGKGWVTCCPIHDDDSPSLSIALNNKGGLIVNCHAGCHWKAVKDELVTRGLLSGRAPGKRPSKASYIWNKSRRNDTEIQRYLLFRGIKLNNLPNCFRYNQYNGRKMVVSKVSQPCDSAIEAIHRTYLGEGYQCIEKKMLGPCKGRAVWFAEPQERMLVGEGIETTLSAMAAVGTPAIACLSAGNMKTVVFPSVVKEVIILVDSDSTFVGQKAAEALARRFEGTVNFATPCDSCFSDNPEKLDFNDLTPEQIRKRFEQLLDINKRIVTKESPAICLVDENGKLKSKATLLIEIGSQYELFHDETGEGYVAITMDNHLETWPIKSNVFSEFLGDQFFLLTGKGASRNTITDATDTLRSKARTQGKEHKVHKRVAEENGNIYIDLCDERWRAVEITKDYWKIVDTPPVKFLRSDSSLALPVPENDGSLKDLWPLLNRRAEDRPLVAGFLVRALCPNSPYFGLAVTGEQGTGKSTFSTIIRSLCDPSSAMLRPPPKNESDFYVGAINNYCLTFDNLSGIPGWQSDALCRVLTKGSFATRTLYSTTGETTVPIARPAILNGIDDLAARADLADRCIAINLQPISETARREERELWEQFHTVKGKVFGVLLSGLCSALKNIDSVVLSHRPRMIDAAKWATAAEEGLGLEPEVFIDAYIGSQRELVSICLESSPFIAALLDMVKERGEWAGSPSDLLALLPRYARDQEAVNSKAWPKSPAWVTKVLKRNAPAVRKINIDIELSRNASGGYVAVSSRKIALEKEVIAQQDSGLSRDLYHQEDSESGENMENTVNTVNADTTDGNDDKKTNLSKGDAEQVECII